MKSIRFAVISNFTVFVISQIRMINFFQSGEASRRYESFGRTCKNINPPNDLTAFVKTLHIPDTMTVSKHVFQPPTNKPGQVPLQVNCYIFTRDVCLYNASENVFIFCLTNQF